MSWRTRLVPFSVFLIAACCAPAQQANDRSAQPPNFEGVWSWGSPQRSANVPFLRISRNGAEWIVETKHYMHDYFVSRVKNVSARGNHLDFAYWYAPLHRWARCSLDLADDMMTGQCDGELNAREWGQLPTYLWRNYQAR